MVATEVGPVSQCFSGTGPLAKVLTLSHGSEDSDYWQIPLPASMALEVGRKGGRSWLKLLWLPFR
jgi:hypothetical protein